MRESEEARCSSGADGRKERGREIKSDGRGENGASGEVNVSTVV